MLKMEKDLKMNDEEFKNIPRGHFTIGPYKVFAFHYFLGIFIPDSIKMTMDVNETSQMINTILKYFKSEGFYVFENYELDVRNSMKHVMNVEYY